MTFSSYNCTTQSPHGNHTMIIRAKLRTKIKEHLPEGYAKLIAAQCKVHENTVYNVLNHERDNHAVALALLKLSNKHKDEKEKAHREAAAIAEQL